MNKARRESILAVAVGIEPQISIIRENIWDSLALGFDLTPDEVIEIRNEVDKRSFIARLDST